MTDEEKLEELKRQRLKCEASLRALKQQLRALERMERTDRATRPSTTFREGFQRIRVYDR